MKNFMALYQMPVAGLEEWMAKPESERTQAEQEMKGQWDAWLEAHKGAVLNTIAVGATKRVSGQGIEDTKNGIMLSSYVQAQSPEEAAAIFEDHPHLAIPGAYIEIMETRQM